MTSSTLLKISQIQLNQWVQMLNTTDDITVISSVREFATRAREQRGFAE